MCTQRMLSITSEIVNKSKRAKSGWSFAVPFWLVGKSTFTGDDSSRKISLKLQ